MARQSRLDWFSSQTSDKAACRRRGKQTRSPQRRSLRFEPLEDRRLLAITVNTLVDENDGVGVGGVSLRDAIVAATPGDTIDFNVTGTVVLEHGELLINKHLTILGPGANLLTIDADGASRVLNIDDSSSSRANVNLFDLTLTGGITGGDGGGILNRENLSVTRSLIVGNKADDGGGIGNFGGVFSIVDSTISDNESTGVSGGGGGVFNFASNVADTSLISNSTISGNSATTRGGGVNNFIGTIAIEFTTITQNEAPNFAGSGVASWGDQSTTATEFYSTIVAGNINTDVDLVGSFQPTFFSNGYNLIGSGTSTGSFMVLGDQRNIADPLLGPLADNGGPTPTHQLLVGSPAIDAGDPDAEAGLGNVPEFDQRGGPSGRVFDGDNDSLAVIDIGAFESDVFYLVVDTLIDESDGDFSAGDFSLREAIEQAAVTVAGSPTIVFDPALFTAGPESIFLDVALGQLKITAKMVVEGPGADILTIVAAPFRNIFVVDDLDNLTQSDVAIRGLTLTGGNDPNGGGAIFTRERLEVADSLITGNTAQWGGGIYNDLYGELTVVNSEISGNDATSSGGGLYNWGGSVFIFDSVISGNDSANEAGGIKNVNNGALNVARSTISGNTAQSIGGGLYNGDGNVNIADSTISGNTADAGGGIYVLTPTNDTTSISNSTISGNIAPLGGAGVFTFSGHTVIQFCTISENDSNDFAGSGVVTWGDPAFALTEVRSTIVAGNHHTDVAVTGGFVDTFDSLGYNAIGTGSLGHFTADGDLTGVIDPKLGPLADNGGPTHTHALLHGSPAIDAGDPLAIVGASGVPEFDQRGPGFARIRDGNAAEDVTIDIGAFEVQQFVVAPKLLGDYNRDNSVDAADYTIWRNTLDDDVEQFEGADGDGDGIVDPDDYGVWKSHFGESIMEGGGGSGAAELVARSESSANESDVASELNLSIALPTRVLPRTPVVANPSKRVEAAGVNRDALIAWLAAKQHQETERDVDTNQKSKAADAAISDADPIADALADAFAAFGA